MKIIIAPDSFKETLSAPAAADIMADAFKAVFPNANIIKLPLADGGEGTVDCFVSAGAQKIAVHTIDGYGDKIRAYYCITGMGAAVLESAQAVGLGLSSRRSPELCSSYGLGACVNDALSRGCREIIIGLGGTGSNDGGCGLAAALGTIFYDIKGNSFTPVGATLHKIEDYDDRKSKLKLQGITVRALCDVSNPFYGPEGAACVFAAQKGADTDTVTMLDAGLKSLAALILVKTKIDLQKTEGTGAAGGLGGGIVAFLGGRLVPGIDEILRLTRFDQLTQDADLCVTGEGSTDAQTTMGKTISGLLKHISGFPLITVSGIALQDAEKLYDMGLAALCAVNRVQADICEVKKTAAETLFAECRAVASLVKLGRNLKT